MAQVQFLFSFPRCSCHPRPMILRWRLIWNASEFEIKSFENARWSQETIEDYFLKEKKWFPVCTYVGLVADPLRREQKMRFQRCYNDNRNPADALMSSIVVSTMRFIAVWRSSSATTEFHQTMTCRSTNDENLLSQEMKSNHPTAVFPNTAESLIESTLICASFTSAVRNATAQSQSGTASISQTVKQPSSTLMRRRFRTCAFA